MVPKMPHPSEGRRYHFCGCVILHGTVHLSKGRLVKWARSNSLAFKTFILLVSERKIEDGVRRYVKYKNALTSSCSFGDGGTGLKELRVHP